MDNVTIVQKFEDIIISVGNFSVHNLSCILLNAVKHTYVMHVKSKTRETQRI